jgi:hydroxymethylpyrimidine pyrophosphatase-like HAD family hydrolase
VRSISEGAANAYLTDAGRTVQMSGRGAGKLPAIEAVRARLGLDADEIAVFGDDINDMEMISFYKNSVAMGNAAPEIARAAGYVTSSNDEDGVAAAIEKAIDEGLM